MQWLPLNYAMPCYTGYFVVQKENIGVTPRKVTMYTIDWIHALKYGLFEKQTSLYRRPQFAGGDGEFRGAYHSKFFLPVAYLIPSQ